MKKLMFVFVGLVFVTARTLAGGDQPRGTLVLDAHRKAASSTNGQTRFRREYVPQSELARVRRWIRRSRADRARGRAVLSLLRHYVTGMEARARYRARMRAAQRS